MATPLDAYYLDRAVMHFGSGLEAALKKATSPDGKKKKKPSEAQINAKVQSVLAQWLGESVQKRYRDPATKFTQGV